MAIPKLALIPSGVKAGKLYSVLPTNGDGDFTTTRASVATRVNENGLIEEVASNVSRLDYSDGACPSLLLEPASTNLITYSEDFTQWVKTGSGAGALPIITPNNSVSPDGNLNGTRLQCELNGGTTSSDVSYIKIGGISGTQFISSKSLYIRNNLATDITLFIGINNTLDKITIPANAVFTRYKVEGQNINTEFRIGIRGGAVNSDSIDIDIFGAQLEQNSYSSSYIKTVGTSQTRSADTANGAGNSTVINSSEGVLYFEGSSLANSVPTQRMSLSDGTSANRIYIQNSATTNQIYVSVVSGGVSSVDVNITSYDTTQFNKIAIKYKANDFALWINGVEEATDISAVIPIGLNELAFDAGDGGLPFYGKTKSLQVYTTALSDIEIEKLTSWTSFTAMANALNYTII